MDVYTLESLKAAQEEQRKWGEAFANDSSNNPDTYIAQRRDSGIKVRLIDKALKSQGVIAKTAHELLSEALHALYPNAQHRTTVTFEGKKYRRCFTPLVKSRSRKTVKEWGREWVELR